MQKQNFVIRPGGMVQGGTMSYVFDPATGKIDYSFDAKYKIMWGEHELKSDGSTKVDPKSLLSSNGKPGAVFNFGPLKATVLSVKGTTASCQLDYHDKFTASGTAILDLSAQYVKIMHIVAAGSYGLLSVNVSADAV